MTPATAVTKDASGTRGTGGWPASATMNKKQRVDDGASNNAEEAAKEAELVRLVRRATELPAAHTLHELWVVLDRLPAQIVSPTPSEARCLKGKCSFTELASLLCLDGEEREAKELLTELKHAWERVEKPRPKHDQLQMRVVQWLKLWLDCGVTDLGRLNVLVRRTREQDSIARDARPNPPGESREKRHKEDFEWCRRFDKEAAGATVEGQSAAPPERSQAGECAGGAVSIDLTGGQNEMAGGDEED